MATRVLVTNDDGVGAPGIRWLAQAAVAGGYDVTVAAPREEASGMSAALTAVVKDGRVVFDRTELAGVPAYGVAASPGYIVVLAGLGAFGPPPDLVLSGVNRGANAGNAILHSGTVGAALTAAANGIRAMAVSLDVISSAAISPAAGIITPIEPVDDESHHWVTAADVACHLLPWLAAAPARTVLNVNVPNVPRDAVAGLRQASLAPFGHVQMAITETGRDYVRVALEETGAREIPGSDLAWLAAGYAAVSVVRPASAVTDVALPTDLA